MSTSSFLSTAGARADHLRELSHHLRSLDLASASLSEVEQEVPELEVAMTVYRRLNAEGANASDPGDPHAFLSLAENRTDHLRQLSHFMNSLQWAHASLTDAENEIPELELAMTVYRRLTGETDDGSAPSPAATAPPAMARVGGGSADDDAYDATTAPSFSQFSMQHLDPATPPTADTAADPNGSR